MALKIHQFFFKKVEIYIYILELQEFTNQYLITEETNDQF